MITLTDGTKTIELTKDEMEIIEEGLQELAYEATFCVDRKKLASLNTIFDKLRGLKYE